MKTVFNWTVGSFFRSIGRIVAYVFIGGLIAYLLNRSGFDWGKLLGIEKVYADSQTSAWWESYYTSNDKTTQFTYTANYAKGQLTTSGNNINVLDFWLGTNITKRANEDYVYIPFMLLGETYNDNVASNDILVCDDWSNYNDSTGTGFFCKSFVDSNSNIHVTSPIQFKMNLKLRAINGTDAMCTMIGNIAKCYLKDGETYGSIRVEYNYSLGNYTNLYFAINRGISTYKDGITSVTDSINQQTQQQQQYYNDTNSTSESNTATSYFNNQQDDTPSALTSAITSPLRIIDNAIQGTHNSLCFTLNSKQSCIPSGDIIWQNYDTSNSRYHWFDSSFVGGGGSAVSKFQQFFNIVVAGYLCYKMLLSMMRIFNDSVDPTVSRIEVMKL